MGYIEIREYRAPLKKGEHGIIAAWYISAPISKPVSKSVARQQAA